MTLQHWTRVMKLFRHWASSDHVLIALERSSAEFDVQQKHPNSHVAIAVLLLDLVRECEDLQRRR